MTDTDDSTLPPAGDPAATPDPKQSRRWLTWTLLGVVGVVVLVFGAILLYAFVLNDAPDELDADDLSNALATTVPDATAPAGTSAPPATAPATDPSAGVTSAPPAGDSFDGDWVPTEASEFGYRVEEVLAGVNPTAVGRSNEIDGLLTIEGTTATVVEIEVLIENITSDNALRDDQFTGRIMNAEEFPTATFSLTEPIEFGTIPVGGEQITVPATGELTLRGVTNPVTFDVTAQTTGGRIGVLGSIPVVFEDYGIENPSFGQVRTEDEGLVEFVLVFERA
ncbi:MAG TPA: YceI family protein [Ilumatobacteraceae bacterium]|nr:YceI family protein [Ilumatobacteraceae bacterium]